MSKQDVVQAYLSGLSQAQLDAANSLYDAAVADQPVSNGGLSQADVDAAVKAQSDADAAALASSQSGDAQALSDAVAKVQAQLDAANQALADMTAKDQKDSAAVLALKASAAGIQAVLDQLNAIVNPPAPDAPAAA